MLIEWTLPPFYKLRLFVALIESVSGAIESDLGSD